MTARVRPLDRRIIRLREPLLAHVQHLAGLAGVGIADVVDWILTEVFEGHTLPEPDEATDACRLPPRRSRRWTRRPADVIPIGRRRSRTLPAPVSMSCDLAYLRRQAADTRERARAARRRAATARRTAAEARLRTNCVLDCTGRLR